MRKILAIDPSGNFEEGKGQTGWSLFDEDGKIERFGLISAKNYNNKHEYWHTHAHLIETIQPDFVVFERFVLYATKAKSQINSEMETPKLIGFLEMTLYYQNIPYTTQLAAEAKTRYTDDILVYKKYIRKDGNGRYYIDGINVAGHVIDSMRHGLLYILKERNNG